MRYLRRLCPRPHPALVNQWGWSCPCHRTTLTVALQEDTSKEKDKAVKRAAQAELNLQEIRNRLASNATTRGAAEEELAALEKR